MDDDIVNKYFEENAAAWLADAYVMSDHAYPVGAHRSRIVMAIIKQHSRDKQLNLLDIGCGGGNLCFLEAEAGHRATGVDSSEAMISRAIDCQRSAPVETQGRLQFIHSDFRGLGDVISERIYDVVTAIGVMYHCPEDDSVLSLARDLLEPGGLFVVSCRNRLFNMVSLSENTVNEIDNGTASDLITQIKDLDHSVTHNRVDLFVEKLRCVIDQAFYEMEQPGEEHVQSITQDDGSARSRYTFHIDGRQHTPKQLTAHASKFNFVNVGYYGVHPHLFAPQLNRLLPTRIMHRLSDCLCAFEDLPISMLWSSQFIGVFKKQ